MSEWNETCSQAPCNLKKDLPAAAIIRWPCKHTPGPWRISTDGIISSDAVAIEIAYVAQGSDGVMDEEVRGNGVLMGNALRLMEALKKLLVVSECFCTRFTKCYRCEGVELLKSLEQAGGTHAPQGKE